MLDTFRNRNIRIAVCDILSDNRDSQARASCGALDTSDDIRPGFEVRRAVAQAELRHHAMGEALFLEAQRHFVDRLRVACLDYRFLVDIAEEGDLLLHLGIERKFRAADQNIGLDTDFAQLDDAVLGRLGLHLAPRPDIRDEGDVDIEHIRCAHIFAQLADGFEKRQALDVADSAADLGDNYIGLAFTAQANDALLDLIGDMRDHLDRPAQIVAAALFGDHGRVDSAGGDGRSAVQADIHKPLIVPKVEIGLSAVVGDKHLPVLIGIHGPGIDIDIRIELEHRNAEAPIAQQQPPQAKRS